MRERPNKKECLESDKLTRWGSYVEGWNDCIDAWEKSKPIEVGRPQRHVYLNDDTHNEKEGYCLTCEQFSPCSHNALIDQYEAWEKSQPKDAVSVRS